MNFYDIASVLSKNVKANNIRNQICGALKLEPYEVQEIGKTKTNYDFYMLMLTNWQSTFSSSATPETLEKALRSLNLTAVADELFKPNNIELKDEPESTTNGQQAPKTIAQYVFSRAAANIRRNLATDSIVSVLYCNDTLTLEEYEDIKDLKNYTNRNKLINTMMKKDKKAIDAFIAALKSETTSQDSIWIEIENLVRKFENR